MKIQPLLALDIGSTKVACAIGLPLQDSSGFELLGSSLVPYPALSETWLGDPVMVSRTIEQALEATGIPLDISHAHVVFNHPLLASERVRAAITLADEPVSIREQDLQRLQASALHQVLSIDREALIVERLGCAGNGFEGVRDPRGLPATRLMGTFHILTMPTAARCALVQVVEATGLEMARMTYSLCATLAGLGDDTLAHKRVLMIDVGGLSTDVGLFVEGTLHAVQIVPWGGLSLASHIAKDLQVTNDQALTWSLEGSACRKPEVRTLIQHHWKDLEQAIRSTLQDQPRPDAIFIAGRAALADGFAEWVERATGTSVSLCRSPRTQRSGDLARQAGLGAAIGALELSTRSANGHIDRPASLVNRLIDRTRTILTEYF